MHGSDSPQVTGMRQARVSELDQRWATEVLAEITRVRREKDGRPIVVLDIDLTLFDNRERTRHILRDYLLASARSESERVSALLELERRQIGYSIQENMAALGVEGDEFRQSGLPFWMERFFSDRYARFDVPYPGAPAACRRMREAGAVLVYLTGRYMDTQATGTVDSLRHYGFPVAEMGTQLVMKTSRSESDTDYKRRVTSEIRGYGNVVAAVDNEPGHCNTMASLLPGARVAWMDTLHSGKGGPLAEGVVTIQSFLGFGTQSSGA